MSKKQEETAKTIKELIADQNRLFKEQLRIVKEQAGIESDLLSDQQDISNVIKDQITNLKFQRTEKSLLRKITNDINKISQESYSIGKRQLGVDKQSEIFSKQKVSLEQKIRLLKQQQAKFGKSQNELDQDIAQTIKLQVDEATKLKLQIDGIVESSQRIKDNFGVKTFGNLATAVKSVPGITAFSAPFEAASEAALNTSQDIEHSLKTGEGLTKDMVKKLGLADKLKSKSGETLAGSAASKKFDKLGKPDGKKLLGVIDRKGFMSAMSGIKSLAKSLKAALAPAVLLAELLKAVIASDAAAGEMAKSMNMTYADSVRTRAELTQMANSQLDITDMSKGNAVTTAGLQETLLVINKTLGTGTMLSEDMLVQFTQMRKMAGFTNEELMGIASISLATGKDMETITGEFMAQATISASQNGVLLNEKDLLKDIGKVSAATTLSFGKNPALIAEAVATAKSLGMELDKVDAIASSLLDFESSITNELEAELLLGKDINLEKARQAALNNDLATVAKEISNQIGDSAEFSKMNRIQQEALAKSVGMNREDLAKTLYVQEQLVGATGKQAEEKEKLINASIEAIGLEATQKKLADEGVDGLKNQQSQAERLSNTMDKLKEVFVSVAEPILAIGMALTPVIEAIGFLVSGIMSISGVVGKALGSMKEMGAGGVILGGILAALAAAAAFAALSFIPVVGPALGIAAGLAIVGAYAKAVTDTKAKKAGDMFSAAKGKTMVSPAEGGLFELSDNDDFAAAPGLGQMLAGGNTSSNPEPENTQSTTVVQSTTDMSTTNALLEKIFKKTPEMAPLGLYEVQ